MPRRFALLHGSIIGQKKSADTGSADFLPSLRLDTGKAGQPLPIGQRNQARLTFSSILKMPLGERTKRRLKALPRQRRSRVLRRVRLISAMMISDLCVEGTQRRGPKNSVNP